MNHVYAKAVFSYICCHSLTSIVAAGKASYRVDDPLQGFESIIDGEDVILTVCNLCQLERKEEHHTVNAMDRLNLTLLIDSLV